MHQWMGNLFYRGASPTELESMSWKQLRYWNGWHVVMNNADKDAANQMRGK